MENLNTSLLLTLLGMGLVFGAILLFWGLMPALVRIAAGRQQPASEDESMDLTALETEQQDERLRQRAALAAVAAVLALQAEGPKPFPLPPTALVSTWQAVMRAKLLGQQGARR